MTAFTVWKFDSPEGAGHAASQLKHIQGEGMIKILDHAVVSWPADAKRPTTEHSHDDVKHGTGWGAFWGLLLGSLFFLPLIGAAAGAAIGGYAKATQGVGISKEQLETIREKITPGTSALFLVTEAGNLDLVGERFHGSHMKLIDTNLTDAEKRVLLETFGGQ
jgi:uncharacterized membrane protein